jgi:hypothetical protein
MYNIRVYLLKIYLFREERICSKMYKQVMEFGGAAGSDAVFERHRAEVLDCDLSRFVRFVFVRFGGSYARRVVSKYETLISQLDALTLQGFLNRRSMHLHRNGLIWMAVNYTELQVLEVIDGTSLSSSEKDSLKEYANNLKVTRGDLTVS